MPSRLKAPVLWLLKALRFPGRSRTIVADPLLKMAGKEYNRQRFYGPRKIFCYAPFRSIFVSYDGRVSPCYACRSNASLKETNLEEIWNGPEFRSLRDQLRSGIIPDECSFCRGHLRNGNYASILANKYDHHAAPNKGNPAIVEFELGNECNLECVMCCGELSSSIRARREKKEKVETLVDEHFDRHFDFCLPHLRAAEFTGGDPFLIPVYEKIWTKMATVNSGIDILITTNANTMNERVETLLRSDLRLSFNISIDSLKKEVYEKIRVNANFEKVQENIRRFAAYAHQHHTSIGFLVCPLRLNRYELQDFLPFAKEHGASLSYHVVFKPADLALWTLDSKDLFDLHTHLAPYAIEGSGFIESLNARNYRGLVDLIQVWAEKAVTREAALEQKNNDIAAQMDNAKQRFWKQLGELVAEEDLHHHFSRTTFLIQKMGVTHFPELVYLRLAEIPAPEVLRALTQTKDEALIEKLLQYHNDVYYRIFAGDGLSDNDKYERSMKGMEW